MRLSLENNVGQERCAGAGIEAGDRWSRRRRRIVSPSVGRVPRKLQELVERFEQFGQIQEPVTQLRVLADVYYIQLVSFDQFPGHILARFVDYVLRHDKTLISLNAS